MIASDFLTVAKARIREKRLAAFSVFPPRQVKFKTSSSRGQIVPRERAGKSEGKTARSQRTKERKGRRCGKVGHLSLESAFCGGDAIGMVNAELVDAVQRSLERDGSLQVRHSSTHALSPLFASFSFSCIALPWALGTGDPCVAFTCSSRPFVHNFDEASRRLCRT